MNILHCIKSLIQSSYISGSVNEMKTMAQGTDFQTKLMPKLTEIGCQTDVSFAPRYNTKIYHVSIDIIINLKFPKSGLQLIIIKQRRSCFNMWQMRPSVTAYSKAISSYSFQQIFTKFLQYVPLTYRKGL